MPYLGQSDLNLLHPQGIGVRKTEVDRIQIQSVLNSVLVRIEVIQTELPQMYFCLNGNKIL
jgi:hypothetical protein